MGAYSEKYALQGVQWTKDSVQRLTSDIASGIHKLQQSDAKTNAAILAFANSAVGALSCTNGAASAGIFPSSFSLFL